MKNPWMSMWLSAVNSAVAPARGQMAAEMARQQNAMAKAWTEQATRAWMSMWFPWLPQSGKRDK